MALEGTDRVTREGWGAKTAALFAVSAASLLIGCSEVDAAGSGGEGGSSLETGSSVETGSSPSGTTGGYAPSEPITREEIVAGFVGEYQGEDGTQLRVCAVDAPDLGEAVLYVARGQLQTASADRQVVLVLDPHEIAAATDGAEHHSVVAHFYPMAGTTALSCDQVDAAVAGAGLQEKPGCIASFWRPEASPFIDGHRLAAVATQAEPEGEVCFPGSGAGLFFRWKVGAEAVEWTETSPAGVDQLSVLYERL